MCLGWSSAKHAPRNSVPLEQQAVVVVNRNQATVEHPVKGGAQCHPVPQAVRSILSHGLDVRGLGLGPSAAVAGVCGAGDGGERSWARPSGKLGARNGGDPGPRTQNRAHQVLSTACLSATSGPKWRTNSRSTLVMPAKGLLGRWLNRRVRPTWSYPAFTDGWFLGLMVSDMIPFLPRHSSERGNVHRRRGERPGEVRSASVARALHLRFRPHG